MPAKAGPDAYRSCMAAGDAANAAASPLRSSVCTPHPREKRKVQIRSARDGAEQVARLAQPAQPRAQPVPRAADDDVEAGGQRFTRLAASWPVTRRKICSRFEPAVGEIGARRELGERAVGDLATAVHDDHARADFLDQVQQVRRQENRGAGARARDDRLAHAADADRIEPGQRLVEQQRRRVAHQAAGDHDLLPHAARQLARAAIAPCPSSSSSSISARARASKSSTAVQPRRPAAGAPRP